MSLIKKIGDNATSFPLLLLKFSSWEVTWYLVHIDITVTYMACHDLAINKFINRFTEYTHDEKV